jgi:hypothetical protein
LNTSALSALSFSVSSRMPSSSCTSSEADISMNSAPSWFRECLHYLIRCHSSPPRPHTCTLAPGRQRCKSLCSRVSL